MPRKLRSSGAVPPSDAVDQAASRNSSFVAARSWARVRTFSGSITTAMEPAGSWSRNGTMASTSTGARDSMPSTAMPPAIFSSMSAAAGSWDFRVAARDMTEGVIRISRHGGAWSSVGWCRPGAVSERWSATANQRICSTSSPKNSTRMGWSSVGGKTSSMPPRTANSPRRVTMSTRA